MMRIIITLLVALEVVAIFLIWHEPDENGVNSDAVIQPYQTDDEEYCEMLSLWFSQLHLPEMQRDGWPPYQGTEICDD